MFDNIPSLIMLALMLVLYVLLAVKFLRNRLAPVKQVRAKVVDKNKVEFPSKYGKNVKYAVVFQTESGKKLSFYVSEFSFGGYRIHEGGTLTYKGDRIMDFS